jgi:hypothetical protein
VLFRGERLNHRWKRKFIEDMLILISILIARKVVLRAHKDYSFFPLWSGLYCESIAKDSSELKRYLDIAIDQLQKKEWQERFLDGFHVMMFYNISDITNTESRYLGDITVWEFLYYCSKRHVLTYDQLVCESLNTKINFLVKTYLLPSARRIHQDRFDVFTHLRNQLAHNGKLPIQNPKSKFGTLDWNGCKQYMNLFKLLIQAVVLKTLGIDAIGHLGRDELEELVKRGRVSHYH